MKFEAYRIDKGVYEAEKHAINYNLWAVRGQRETDLNWPVLAVCNSEEEAKAIALKERAEHGRNGWCPVFDPSGYGYKDIDHETR